MRIPDTLATLADYGIIEEVVRPLMSGKEAQVYLVISGGEERVAKIYKEAENRTFKHRADYTEGRRTRNTRDQRAITKRSAHGRAQDEAAWRATEHSMIYRLQSAGVRVPIPYEFIDGVLVMELVKGEGGYPAPRLGDLSFTRDEAHAIFQQLLQEVVRMLCAGVVHGDLSDFNVLLASDGPVLIDFPQSVDPAHNPNARKLLLRDVNNLHDFVARFDREAPRLPYAEEMWDLYESNRLTPDTRLTGNYRVANRKADTASVMRLIDDAKRDERRRREHLGLAPVAAANEGPRGPKVVRDVSAARPQRSNPQQSRPQAQQQRPNPHSQQPRQQPQQPRQPQQQPQQPRQQPQQPNPHSSQQPRQPQQPRPQHQEPRPQHQEPRPQPHAHEQPRPQHERHLQPPPPQPGQPQAPGARRSRRGRRGRGNRPPA